MSEEIVFLASLSEEEREMAVAAAAQDRATLYLLISNSGDHYAIPAGAKTYKEMKGFEVNDTKEIKAKRLYDHKIFDYLKGLELPSGPNEIINSKQFALDLLTQNIFRNHYFRTEDGRQAMHARFKLHPTKKGFRYSYGMPTVTDLTRLAIRFHKTGQESKAVCSSRQSDLDYLIGLYLDETENVGGLAGFKRFMIEKHHAEIILGDRITWPVPGAEPKKLAIATVRNKLSGIKGKRKS